MSAKIQSYPVYVYDEPATYNDFTGGINTDPSNEHLLNNELRDCVNMHYLSGALVKRKGAKEVAKLVSPIDLHNIQGVFLFTYRITYIIVAADGKLYQGVFHENTDIQLTRLRIDASLDLSEDIYNPQNLFVGLKEYYTENINNRHEGFIHSYEITSDGDVDYNFRGPLEDITASWIYKNDIVEFQGIKYKCLENHEKELIYPTNKDFWEELSYDNAYAEWSKYLQSAWGSNSTILSINTWVPSKYEWEKGYIVKYEERYFKCKQNHYNYGSTPSVNSTKWEPLHEGRELIFQNYRNIEAATFNNKLYIATGTRFIEVYLQTNQLMASVIKPYICNNTEISLIGYNYMSPYPELCRSSQSNTVTTSIGGLLARKTKLGTYILEPQMNFQYGESAQDYWYRWEKRINNQWYIIHTFKSQDPTIYTDDNMYIPPITTLTVRDADTYQYRVTFAKDFERVGSFVSPWDSTKKYNQGDFVLVGTDTYKCLITHTPSYEKILSENTTTKMFGKEGTGADIQWENNINEFSKTGLVNNTSKTFWQLVHEQEEVLYYDIQHNKSYKVDDYAINKVTGSYFGQAVSTLAKDLEPNDTFNIIHTCTKLHVDGDKILLYGDRYNSGQWFKTIVKNPAYITDKGCLSFKTTKNEELIKVVAFQGNIVCFANSTTIGGSIHLVKGNGDDYDNQDGYYSPYRRNTINASISCDNPDTVQICDNLLVFKYFNRIYYINASDLSNDVIQVTPCNDRVLHPSSDVEIPWEDNTCISEVTDTYYGLIWKERYEIDNNGDLILKHPGLRVKMYYKMANRLNDNSYNMPWLRDESTYLNVSHCIYLKGKPIFLYNNILLTFEDFAYSDLDTDYECKIHFRGVDLNYPKMFKLISNVLVYYHRNQYTKLDFHMKILNEAGHLLLDSTKSKKTIQDLKALKADSLHSSSIRLDSTILDTRVLHTTYKFPCFLADTILTCKNNKEFSLSSITYTYTTIQTPETNPYDLYTSIIRKKDLLTSNQYKGGH